MKAMSKNLELLVLTLLQASRVKVQHSTVQQIDMMLAVLIMELKWLSHHTEELLQMVVHPAEDLHTEQKVELE